MSKEPYISYVVVQGKEIPMSEVEFWSLGESNGYYGEPVSFIKLKD